MSSTTLTSSPPNVLSDIKPNVACDSPRWPKQHAAITAEKSLKENYAAGGILDSQLESQQWADTQTKGSDMESISRSQKRKAEPTDDLVLSLEQLIKSVKKIRTDLKRKVEACEPAEAKVAELVKTSEKLHKELMVLKNEMTRLIHILGKVKGDLSRV
ncbi:hypothetical protein H0H92_002837 [Tricholoma furcatifolium]|nr:hypothetical protein H0H92_002837 [Tricholoma furcatifolium]